MSAYTALLISSDHVGWTELRAILARMPDVQVVGDTADPRRAVALAAAADPDVIVADAVVGGVATLPPLADLRRERNLRARIVLFAARYEPARAPDPLAGGVVGYLLWGELTGAVLGHCLAALLGGDIVLGSRAVATGYLAALRGPRPAAPPLTANEQAVLQLLAEGLTNRAIAGRTGLSERSVERVVAGLERKLGAATKFALAVRATRLGLIG